MKTFKEDPEYIQEIIEKRGFIISKAITLEGIFDSIITCYFIGTANRKEIFHSQLLSTINSIPKIEILKTILKQVNLDEKETKQLSKLFKLLKNIFELRNGMAHWQWSLINNEKEIEFINRRKQRPEIFNDSQIELFLKNWKLARDVLSILYFKYFYNKK